MHDIANPKPLSREIGSLELRERTGSSVPSLILATYNPTTRSILVTNFPSAWPCIEETHRASAFVKVTYVAARPLTPLTPRLCSAFREKESRLGEE